MVPARVRAEQRPLGLRAQLTPVDIGGQIVLKIMVAEHFVLLAALFVQPHPETAVLHENVLDTHGERRADPRERRSEEHTSELQSLMRISYAVFCLKKKQTQISRKHHNNTLRSTHIHTIQAYQQST